MGGAGMPCPNCNPSSEDKPPRLPKGLSLITDKRGPALSSPQKKPGLDVEEQAGLLAECRSKGARIGTPFSPMLALDRNVGRSMAGRRATFRYRAAVYLQGVRQARR
jgi:hypothetical protein